MLELIGMKKTFRKRYSSEIIVPVDNVDLKVEGGEHVGLLGPSGCGKTTLARLTMKLIKADSGKIILDGTDISDLTNHQFAQYRKNIQMVFQNPSASMDPTRTMKWSLDEAYVSFKRPSIDYTDLCKRFEIPIDVLGRRPMMVSGGEIQRISIMRCIASDPKYMILDEPTSMLDLSIQASVMNMLKELNRDKKKGMLLITHDLDLARCFCDRVYLMSKGRIVESGRTDEVLSSPRTDDGKAFVESYYGRPSEKARV